jgi:hypothetical protein
VLLFQLVAAQLECRLPLPLLLLLLLLVVVYAGKALKDVQDKVVIATK